MALVNPARFAEAVRAAMAQPPTVDETKAPDPLPDVLPVGTMAYAGRDVGGRALSNGDRYPDPRTGMFSYACDIDWPSYYAALRSQPAPVQPTESEGPRVGETWEAREVGGETRSVVLTAFIESSMGGFWTATHTAAHWGYSPPGQTLPDKRQLIRRLPAQPATEGKTDCSSCAIAAEEALSQAERSGVLHKCKCLCGKTWAFLPPTKENVYSSTGFGSSSEAKKPDPYDGRGQPGKDAEIAAVMVKLDERRAAKRGETLRDLDRPLTPPRYPSRYVCVGVMGDGTPVKRREVKGAPSTWPEGSDHE